jgi:uncharacterized protein (TIGR01777 family)
MWHQTGVVRVLFTGGTGFVGTACVAALAERGDEVVVLTRGHGPSAHPPRVSFVTWTPDEDGPWLDEIERADAVVNLAGAGVFDERWSKERLDELERSRVVHTRILAERIARADASKRPKVVVSGSAVGYYGMRSDDEPCTEQHPPGDDELARICIAWEAATKPASDAGVRVVRTRLGLVLGGGGGVIARMVPAFKAFCGGPIGKGTQQFSWIHVEDVVRAILFAVDTPALDGPVNVVAPQPVTMNEFAREMGCAMSRPALFRVPELAAKIALGDRSRALLTGQRVLPKKLDAAGFAFLFPSIREALADILAAPTP